MSAILGVQTAAIPAWLQLHRTIGESIRPTPCRAEPDTWADPPSPELAEYAANLCGRCPAITACRLFADLNRERIGVWAGANRAPRRGRRPNPTTEPEDR